MKFSSIEETVRRIREGGVVIVVDDEDRENEGDFICAAEKITPDIVNFMTQGRGQFCVTLLPERARELRLEPAVAQNTALMRTNYTVMVDLRTNKTGISTAERAATVLAMANPRTRPEDLARPGHVQPIVAQEGGVLRRAGHTEASVDLARMAGLTPMGVLIEILDDNGEMARRDRLFEIATRHKLPFTSIAELIRHRRRHEKLVHRVSPPVDFPTKLAHFKLYGYKVDHESQEPFAIVLGDLATVDAPLVRMHSSCFTGDVLRSLRCDCGDQLTSALERIAKEGAGALVYLPQEGRGIGLIEKIKAYALQDSGMDTVEANTILGYRADMRDYGVGIQILKDLGLTKVRLLTNNPKKLESFISYGYDLQVVDQIPLWIEPNIHSEQYLRTKRDKMGHLLPPDDPGPKSG